MTPNLVGKKVGTLILESIIIFNVYYHLIPKHCTDIQLFFEIKTQSLYNFSQ